MTEGHVMSLTGALAEACDALRSLGTTGTVAIAIFMILRADEHEDVPRAMWWLLAITVTLTITGAALAGAAS